MKLQSSQQLLNSLAVFLGSALNTNVRDPANGAAKVRRQRSQHRNYFLTIGGEHGVTLVW